MSVCQSTLPDYNQQSSIQIIALYQLNVNEKYIIQYLALTKPKLIPPLLES